MEKHFFKILAFTVFTLTVSTEGLAQKMEKIYYYGEKDSLTYTRTKTPIFKQSISASLKTENDEQIVETLNEVRVKAKEGVKNYETLGFHERKGFFHRLFNRPEQMMFGGYVKNSGLATFIKPKNSRQVTFLETLYLKAYSFDPSNLAKIQVHLYPINKEQGIIGEDLLTKDYILKLNEDQEVKEIDLSEEKIKMPKKGVLVVLEGIDKSGVALVEMKETSQKKSKSYFFRSSPEKITLEVIYKKINGKDEGSLNQNFMIGFKTFYLESK